MELIDRYVHEVGRYLPRNNREDIQTELRSLLADKLEDRVEGEATEDDVAALLEEFGQPREVAVSYQTSPQYLIGPELYPTFELVTGIVLIVLTAVTIFNGIMGFLPGGDASVHETLLAMLGMLYQGTMAAVGTIVIVFGILQRLNVKPDEDEEKWNPRDLPEVTDADRVKRGESVAGIVFSVIFLVFLNVFHDRIGLVMTLGGERLLTNVIQDNLWLFNIGLAANLVLSAVLLWQARWHWYTRIAKFATDLFSVYIFYRLAIGISMEKAALVEAGIVEPLPSMFVNLMYGVMILIAVLAVWELAKAAYRMLRQNRGSALTIPLTDNRRDSGV